MRDAFGGAFMLKLFLVFIFVYICFTAIALNYAKAFKVKNTIINYLEKEEIPSLNKMTAEKMDKFAKYIDEQIVGNMNYNMSERKDFCYGYPKMRGQEIIAICNPAGIIISETGKGKNVEGVYYTVSTFLGWDLGFLKSLSSLNGNNSDQETFTGLWRISGQTRLIVQRK